jgi:type VI secretion system protein ImpA
MTTVDELLRPIDPERRGGVDVSYDSDYTEIAARREFKKGDPPDYEEIPPDYHEIAELSQNLLRERTKDLTVAIWYADARLHTDGFGGLDEGLRLIHGLLNGFWDSLFPEAPQDRAFTLEFLADGLCTRNDKSEPIKFVPLTSWGHSLYHFEESKGLRKDSFRAVDPKAKKKKKEEAGVEDPRAPTSENFEAGFTETPKARYKEWKAQLTSCRAAVKELEGVVEKRFKEAGVPRPSFGKLKEALEKVSAVEEVLLKRKLELDPDPPEVVEQAAAAEDPAVEAALAPAASSRGLAPEPVDAADAQRRIAAAARFLRRADATDPAPYLLVRGLRWGELRRGSALDVRLLEAPPTELRTQLKSLLLRSDWVALLDAAEEVMAGPYGRGWLDLQRYVLTALEGLGGPYRAVADAIRQALGALLRDVPDLVQKTLMDDTPTANAETLAWLKTNGLLAGGGGSVEAGKAAAPSPDYDGERMLAEATYEKAMEWVASGNPRRGVELLKTRAEREQSERGRFITESLAAAILVDAGMGAIARPMLETLVERISKQNLETWESAAIVAKPLGLLYRCLPAAETKRRSDLYNQICRLDPVLGISLSGETDGRAARPGPAKPDGPNEPTSSSQNSPPVAS